MPRSSSGLLEDEDDGVEDQDEDESDGGEGGVVGVDGETIPSTIPLTAPTPVETT